LKLGWSRSELGKEGLELSPWNLIDLGNFFHAQAELIDVLLQKLRNFEELID